MDTQKALDIKKALVTLSDALDIDFNQLASNACLFSEEKFEILKEASRVWNKFDSAPFEERGAMLGLDIKTYNSEAEMEADEVIF